MIWYLDVFMKFTQKSEPYQFTVTKGKVTKMKRFPLWLQINAPEMAQICIIHI